MMVHMTTLNDPNNTRLRVLIAQHGLTQQAALDLFNKGMVKPYSVSAWKAFLADRDSARWRRFDDALLAHAEKKFAKAAKSG